MLSQDINKMLKITKELQDCIQSDISDTKQANHDSLFARNKTKVIKMDELLKTQNAISSQLSDNNLEENKDILELLENELHKLHTLNEALANLVLPANEIYKEILDDISHSNGNILEVNA